MKLDAPGADGSHPVFKAAGLLRTQAAAGGRRRIVEQIVEHVQMMKVWVWLDG